MLNDLLRWLVFARGFTSVAVGLILENVKPKREPVPPEKVISPRHLWSLSFVVSDNGMGNYAIAVGRWRGECALAMRWNGMPGDPLGSPQSRGLPTWFILPQRLWEVVLSTVPAERRELAWSALGEHPSVRTYPVDHGW